MQTPVENVLLSGAGLASAQELAALRAERNSLQRQLTAAHRAVEEAYAAGFAAGQKAVQARVVQPIDDQPLLVAAGILCSPDPPHACVNSVAEGHLMLDRTPGGRYSEQQPRNRLSDLRQSFVTKRTSDVPTCPPSNSLQEEDCAGTSLKPPTFECKSPPRRAESAVGSNRTGQGHTLAAVRASTGHLQPPVVTVSPQCMSKQRSTLLMSPSQTASYTTGSNGRVAEADWAAAKQRHIWGSCDANAEAYTPTSAHSDVQNRPKPCTMCTALLVCPSCAVEKPEVEVPVDVRDTAAHDQKRPPRPSSMRRSIQEVRAGRREKREGLEEQFLSMQADVRASADGLPSAVKRSRSGSLWASLPCGHWAEMLCSKPKEGAKGAPSVRRSCSMALPGRNQAAWIPQRETQPEASTEADARRRSFSSYDASAERAQNHTSARLRIQGIRGEQGLDKAAVQSNKLSLMSVADGSKPALGASSERHSVGIHGNSLPPVPVVNMQDQALSVQASDVAPILAPLNGTNSLTNVGREASCMDLVDVDVAGVRKVPSEHQGMQEPDLGFPADAQENWSPCIAQNSTLKRSSSLTELQNMMQCEPTSLPWADHLDGHEPIGAGRTGNISVDGKCLVKKKVLPRAVKRGRQCRG